MLQKIQKVLESHATGDDKYKHLTKEDIAKVENALKDKQQRLHAFKEAASKMQPTSDPVVFAADLVDAQRVSSICILSYSPKVKLKLTVNVCVILGSGEGVQSDNFKTKAFPSTTTK